MDPAGKYVVFIDLDNTLSGTNSGKALILVARDRGLLKLKDILTFVMILLMHKLGLRPAESLIITIGKKVKGMAVSDFENLGEEAFTKYLKDSIFPAAQQALAEHPREKAVKVILSSAVKEVCMPVARYLSIDRVICTEMESRDGHLTGLPAGKYCYGREKEIRLLEFCTKNGYNPGDAFYYADSISDLDALRSVGNPVCINPDRKLRSHATLEKWKVQYWKHRK